ncbi:unnamed protein product [Phyllotreta striolata]|uniref:Inter-alpha-trypsin inhibitor heavy chain H4-like n=1 Tax=Phyllotreta striolata TaxID=444603 RepID=A0A9N9TNP5_PHYSR|nr:unnamed protein product [Phyllotreta striolata]
MKVIFTAFLANLCLGWVLGNDPVSLVLSTDPTPVTPSTTIKPLPIYPIPPQPIDPGFAPSFSLSPLPPPPSNKEEHKPEAIIDQFNITSKISNRFAKTLITSKVKNPAANANEVVFSVVLPENAFISEFVMEIDGKSYKAYVKEKEEAKAIYDKAVQSGRSAGHVATSVRDSNRFTVSVNVEPEKKVTFLLTYEELLQRRNSQYELVLNVNPGQIVQDMNIEVFVNESRPLQFVRTPSLRTGNEISKSKNELDPKTQIEIINSTSAVATFKPNAMQQKEFAKELGGKENDGLSGQFVLQYDVERESNNGEVLLQDGYFVHFIAPDDLPALPKHIVFVLDTSGSMFGRRIEQLKEAMVSILDQLREGDSFHIIEFNTNVFVWDIDKPERVWADIKNEKEPFEDLLKKEYPSAVPVTKESVAKGKHVIGLLQDDSLTNILSSLETALHVVNVAVKKGKEGGAKQPIVVFLTDGDPTVGNTNTDDITSIVTKINSEKDQVPLFSLSFGDGADKNFLRKISLKNNGFARHIYEGPDAAIQLKEFYKQISSPLLAHITFKYTSEVKDVPKRVFPIYFKGGELVVAGRTKEKTLQCTIIGSHLNGTTELRSVEEKPVGSLERLWAYLTIKQKLEERKVAENKTVLTKEALDLALKYSFVTDVSSLVVVKPNDSSVADTEDASKKHGGSRGGFGYAASMVPMRMSPGAHYYGKSSFLRTSTAFQGLNGPPLMAGQSNYLIPGRRYYHSKPMVATALDPVFDPVIDPVPVPAPLPMPVPIPMVLVKRLPWLSNVLNPNNTLTIKGTLVDLGEHVSILGTENCTGTPKNNTEIGTCTLLSQCPHVYSLLTDFQAYESVSCIVQNNYAGICCPPVTNLVP